MYLVVVYSSFVVPSVACRQSGVSGATPAGRGSGEGRGRGAHVGRCSRVDAHCLHRLTGLPTV